MASLLVTKILSMVSLLVCSLIASFAPYKVAGALKRWDDEQREKEKAEQDEGSTATKAKNGPDLPKSQRIISMMICFSGGVLLAVSIVHMLPEVRRDIKRGTRQGAIVDTPLSVAEIVFCAGFLIVYFVERSVRCLVTIRRDRRLGKLTAEIQPSVLTTEQSAAAFHSTVVQFRDHEAGGQQFSGKKLGHFFIILALSFHSIFEGLAIGLQSSAASIWLLVAGVGAHKFLIAFCIGMELFTSRQQKITTASGYLITFAVMSPIGIAMGIGVTERMAGDEGTQAAVVGILQGLAAGTLLYVTFFELLNDQSAKVKSMPAIYTFLEWLLFASGFLAMTMIDSVGDFTGPNQAEQ